MQYKPVYLEADESQALLSAGNHDAAFLYLYLRNGNDARTATELPGFTRERLQAAISCLQEMGMYQARQLDAPKKVCYNEQDVLHAMQKDMSFQQLVGEVQHRLGKALTTEEMKLLLNMQNYLGLPADVICVLVSFSLSQAKQAGRLRTPSLYQIEKEAYRWSEHGIDTMEAAIQYIHKKEEQNSRLARLMQILQIRGRSLTAPEEKYATAWLQMGMAEELLQMAYEQTCLNTGGMNWAYMNAILLRWKEAGYRTVADVKNKWRKGAMPSGPRQLGEAELEAIQRIMSMDIDDFLGNKTANHIL